MNQITLDRLQSFDPGSRASYPNQRFRCIECGKPNGDRNLEVAHDKGVYKCFKCDLAGRLGGISHYAAPSPQQVAQMQTPKMDWRTRLAKCSAIDLAGTPGETYLAGRGIPLEVAQRCGVGFTGQMFRRAAVLFPIRGLDGRLVAVQGRHLDKAEPRMHTIGPKKEGVFGTPNWMDAPQFAITEAPIDAISLWMLGYPAVAVCGSDLPFWLPGAARGRGVWIASDNDEQGEKDFLNWGAALRKVGADVSRLAAPSRKDWNAHLMAL